MIYNTVMKNTVLIVDDIEMNREMLNVILGDQYNVLMAENGRQAYEILQEKHEDIYVVLLDLLMPEYDGMYFLEQVHDKPWFVDTAVIVVSVENSRQSEKQCFDYGVSDFIHKPYDSTLIQKRVANICRLIEYQRNLKNQIEEKTNALQEQNRQLKEYAEVLKHSRENIVSLLGTVVESRDAESGEHILRVRSYTEILCRLVREEYPQYELSKADMERTISASPLHDIGKIAIPDSILLKQGKLTKPEYMLMQQHTILGAEIINSARNTFDENFRKIASEICMYHHERYDGNGYPLGLKGDAIPIHAQIVGMADVYDALVHQRVYKEAYSINSALHMIQRGECGVFNPVLLECLMKAQNEFQELNRKFRYGEITCY